MVLQVRPGQVCLMAASIQRLLIRNIQNRTNKVVVKVDSIYHIIQPNHVLDEINLSYRSFKSTTNLLLINSLSYLMLVRITLILDFCFFITYSIL